MARIYGDAEPECYGIVGVEGRSHEEVLAVLSRLPSGSGEAALFPALDELFGA